MSQANAVDSSIASVANATKPDTSPICEARAIDVSFGADGGNLVLQNVSLAITTGEVIAILGPSGCGKSTLSRALVGLLTPTRGKCLRMASLFEGFTLGCRWCSRVSHFIRGSPCRRTLKLAQ